MGANQSKGTKKKGGTGENRANDVRVTRDFGLEENLRYRSKQVEREYTARKQEASANMTRQFEQNYQTS